MSYYIKEFKDRYRYLSNFYSSPFQINNTNYKTVEHWFQSQKTTNSREQITIQNAKTPALAKSLGRKSQLRTDWEQIKLFVMKEGVRAKFSQNPRLKQLLIETGSQKLEEGNRWHDDFWGIDLKTNKGLNHLGKILMQLRTEFQEKIDSIPFLIELWRKINLGDNKNWVLFRNGTCVIFTKKGDQLVESALTLIKGWGPVNVGTSSADFSVITLEHQPGWIITCHHPDILTYVSPEEIPFDEINDTNGNIMIGLIGRQKRDLDGRVPVIVHVEDNRID
ncbi:MAG: hypothetical protein BAJALOKI1v1_1470002 [Promethearchaeota archaeon]|nr:MAG: hypothetical protein BAJALOKI1v1_1470002 [Candidatus Lokiarchaeota archaeon]